MLCTKCKLDKPENSVYFPLHNKKKNGLDSWCRSCRSSYRKETRFPKDIIDLDKAREARLLTQCVVCGQEQTRQQLAIDHDHVTKAVRGALCVNCNLGLGHFKDDPTLLRLAALYVEGRCACGNCDVYWGGKKVNDG